MVFPQGKFVKSFKVEINFSRRNYSIPKEVKWKSKTFFKWSIKLFYSWPQFVYHPLGSSLHIRLNHNKSFSRSVTISLSSICFAQKSRNTAPTHFKPVILFTWFFAIKKFPSWRHTSLLLRIKAYCNKTINTT